MPKEDKTASIEAIEAIEDWDARTRIAKKELAVALEAPTDVARALELVHILAELALAFAGDSLSAKASRIRRVCRDTLISLERVASEPEARERIALGQLDLERITSSAVALERRVRSVRSSLPELSAGARAMLLGVEAHCAWERDERRDAIALMVDAFEQLEAQQRLDPGRWLGELSWQAGRLAYWFDMTEDEDAELRWRRRTVALLEQRLVRAPSERGLLGLNQESLGARLVKRGELAEGIAALSSALTHTAHWDDAQKRIGRALELARAALPQPNE